MLSVECPEGDIRQSDVILSVNILIVILQRVIKLTEIYAECPLL